ncbi:hypothetical protein PV11_00736 [Exophiala sideris]|uniref:Uncharacterized protein n=1 Tax=Exophiala sideris TaxID=1016849 RepID=A0A0D1W8F2_9EURO|nr:hypothetical protein PV11_00736 [Exophiala sideris]
MVAQVNSTPASSSSIAGPSIKTRSQLINARQTVGSRGEDQMSTGDLNLAPEQWDTVNKVLMRMFRYAGPPVVTDPSWTADARSALVSIDIEVYSQGKGHELHKQCLQDIDSIEANAVKVVRDRNLLLTDFGRIIPAYNDKSSQRHVSTVTTYNT